ncbi:SDR family NAD(P)-dependent oxidoreductase [Stakelama tenebrarum]|nr:SDR family NAD(P)-dependent oxidoreductase [Sphingosinithalassobacter tenebrarum]
MAQQTVVITGASSGIGLEAAKMFAARGWHVIAAGRTPERCEAARSAIAAAAAEGGDVDFLTADISELAEARRLGEEIARLAPEIHVLINNAGGVRDAYYETSEGVEATFAANHLGPFELTRTLLPTLERTAAGAPAGSVRIIAVSSLAHHRCPGMNWDDFNLGDDFDANAAYCQAKLANILFTRELARRVADDGIVAQSMHPGRVDSNFASHGDQTLRSHMTAADCDPPQKPAETLVWMATAPEAGFPTARFFFDKAEAEAAPQGSDDEAARRLWAASEAAVEQVMAHNA